MLQNVSEAPCLPFDNAEVVKHEGKGIVEIELRSDDNLYIDGKKVVLHLSERQMGDKRVVGHELHKELEDGTQVLLNSNVLDYLYDHPELFPEHWKKNERGETLYIFFWGSIFRNPSNGNLYVHYLYWCGAFLYNTNNKLKVTALGNLPATIRVRVETAKHQLVSGVSNKSAHYVQR